MKLNGLNTFFAPREEEQALSAVEASEELVDNFLGGDLGSKVAELQERPS